MQTLMKRLPGIALAALIAAGAWLIGRWLPVMGSPIAGILLGMLLAFWKRPAALDAGIAYTSKKLLQYAIILLGFDMNLVHIVRSGGQTLFLMAFTLTAAFLSAFLLGKLLKVDRHTNILVGVGTAICGGSAIAAAAPVIGAKNEDVARAISTIFLFNVLAAFLFPLTGHALKMADAPFGLWAGTAINDTSSVVAAGYTFSDAAGHQAVIVKLTRTLMIIPVTLALALYTARKQAREGGAGYKFSNIFPWFVLGFIAASVIGTLVPMPEGTGKFLAQAGKFLIVMAMAAIGLNTNIVKLVKSGWRAILLGFGCWAVLSVTSLAVLSFILKF
ncbi:MAG: YeiH family protein [Christensenellales bacterium]